MKKVKFPYMVVIRFQICIFDILNTAPLSADKLAGQL